MEDDKYIIMGIANVDAEMHEIMTKYGLRTPINTIIDLNTKALKNKNMDDELRGYLEKIGENASNMLSMINEK